MKQRNAPASVVRHQQLGMDHSTCDDTAAAKGPNPSQTPWSRALSPARIVIAWEDWTSSGTTAGRYCPHCLGLGELCLFEKSLAPLFAQRLGLGEFS